jgi:hypothetical protein
MNAALYGLQELVSDLLSLVGLCESWHLLFLERVGFTLAQEGVKPLEREGVPQACIVDGVPDLSHLQNLHCE